MEQVMPVSARSHVAIRQENQEYGWRAMLRAWLTAANSRWCDRSQSWIGPDHPEALSRLDILDGVGSRR